MLMMNDALLHCLRARTSQGTRRTAVDGEIVRTVVAVFADNTVLLLRLRDDATLGDLAHRLADCGKRHGGSPVYVRVTQRA